MEPVNSARIHYSLENSQKLILKKKKKKNAQVLNANANKSDPKRQKISM